MKVLFACDYYHPADISGAEISSRLLAEAMVKKKFKIAVITPRVTSSKKSEILGGVRIIRFPLGFKLTAIVSDSPFWFIYSALTVSFTLLKEKPNMIHVHGKNMLIGSFFGALITHTPFIVTVRDYRLLCDLGICLIKTGKICNYKSYFSSDLPEYIKNYSQNNKLVIIYLYCLSSYRFILRSLYRFVLNRADKVICLSQVQEEIFNQAGIKNTKVCHNIINFTKFKGPKEKQGVFVGRYTLGKGKEILDKFIPWFLSKYPEWQFIVVSGKCELKDPRLEVVPHMKYEDLKLLLSKSAFLIQPSVFPEPFGRAALDAISVGTPAIVSDKGGLPEIVFDKRFGEVSEVDLRSFENSVEKVVSNYRSYRQKIVLGKKKLIDMFYVKPVSFHESLYENQV